jgi:hypothetical protein
VSFLGINGTDGDKDNARKAGLIVGDIYFVSKIEINDWYTDVWIDGFDEPFNSVQFSNV